MKKGLTIVLAISTVAFLAACQESPSPERLAETAAHAPTPEPPGNVPPAETPPPTPLPQGAPPEAPAPPAAPPVAPAAHTPPAAPAPPPSAPAPASPPEVEATPALTSRPAPEPRVLAAGTDLPLVLETSVASNTSQVGDRVVASLSEDAAVDGRVILAAGTEVMGRVTLAKQSGRVKGRARLVVEFDEVRDGGSSYRIAATPVDVTAESSKGQDAKIAGGAAAAGAIIGAIAGGGKGALKGGAIGGAAGGAAVLATRGKEVVLEKGTPVQVSLTEGVQID